MSLSVETTIPIIPKEVLFGNPEKTFPQISPDGTMLALLAPVNNVLNLWVGPVGSDDFKPITNDTDRGIRAYIWLPDGSGLIYMQDIGGDENWRLYLTDLATGQTRDLTPFENVRAMPLKAVKEYPDTILIALNKDNPELHDVYRLTLSTGELEKVAENPGNVIGWTADEDLNVPLAQTMTAQGGEELLIRNPGESEWKSLLCWNPDDAGPSHVVGFNRAGDRLYLIDARDANAAQFVAIDMNSGEKTVIADDDHYDVSSVIRHRNTREPQMVAFLRDRLEWVVLDESIREDVEAMQRIHPGDLEILSRTDDGNMWVLRFDAPDSAVQYYLYDCRIGQAQHLFDARSDIQSYVLASMEPFAFTTSDGLTVHGYLSFPPETERRNLPMVLNVHGGPWTRDTWGFHPEAQWLANRGYICMQVNYRGSIGYGKDFMNAADKEWGGKMHDDLVEAVAWAVRQGYADPKRVAIYGGSYGGYAALVGATFTPDLFCCAVDIVGPSNLVTFINSIPPYWRPMLESMRKRVGDPDTEQDFLMSRSPLTKVDQIRTPMLIAQGANDPRVKQAESEQIVAAMTEKGIPHEYLLFPDEGHGFAKPENRMKFYDAAERFLAEHLGGREEEGE